MISGNRSGIDMDVGDWLRSPGLGQYETLFRQNDIDAEVLSELTEGDLEIRRLLRASQATAQGNRKLGFDGNCGEAGGPRSPSNVHGRRRGSPAHSDVLRSRGLDRDVGEARSRGYAGDHRRPSSLLRCADRAQRRL